MQSFDPKTPPVPPIKLSLPAGAVVGAWTPDEVVKGGVLVGVTPRAGQMQQLASALGIPCAGVLSPGAPYQRGLRPPDDYAVYPANGIGNGTVGAVVS